MAGEKSQGLTGDITGYRVTYAGPLAGATLRDYFAVKAMAAIIARGDDENNNDLVAKMAYLYADDMLAAREVKS